MASIYQRGKRWYISYYYQGKHVQKKLGVTSQKLAEHAKKEIEVEMEKKAVGIHVTREMGFSDFSVKYLNYSRNRKAYNSYERDTRTIDKFLVPFFGKKDLAEIRQVDIEKYINRRLKEVLPNTVNKEIICLKHMLKMAVQWDFLRESPGQNVKKLKEKKPVQKFLSEQEVRIILENVNGNIRPVIVGFIHTGCRRNELFNLKWKHVDLENRTIMIMNEGDARTKNEDNRMIPINDILFEVLELLPRRSEYVFCKKDGSPYKSIKESLWLVAKKTGIPKFGHHAFRHFFGSRLARAVDLVTLQKLMGHRDIKSTMIYIHVMPEDMRNAVKNLEIFK